MRLSESHDVKLVETGQPGRYEATLIKAGWGSSGYYSESVLRRDIANAFPRGTHMYIDHPTMTEEQERPERSVKDLAAVLVSDPVMRGREAVAEMEVFSHYRPFIKEVGPHIGLSIRALGEAESGEAEDRQGMIIEKIADGLSVDFVTVPGAGGSVGTLLESARAAAGAMDPEQSNIVFDEVHVLIGEPYGLRRTGDRWCVYNTDTGATVAGGCHDNHADALRHQRAMMVNVPDAMANADVPVLSNLLEAERSYEALLERDVPTAERVSLAKKGQAIPVRNSSGEIVDGRFPMANCGDVRNAAQSIGRASGNTDQIKAFIKRVAGKLSCPVPFGESGSGRANKKEADMADDNTLSELRESIRQLEQKDSEREEQMAEAKLRAERAEDALLHERAKAIVAEAFNEEREGEDALPELPDRAVERVREVALHGKLPLSEDGQIIRAELVERVHKAAREEAEYLGLGSQSGQVNGMGAATAVAESEQDDATEAKLISSFQRMGLSESAAKSAAKGR